MTAQCVACESVWGAVLDSHGVPRDFDDTKKAAIVHALRDLASIGRAVKKREAMGEVELLIADIHRESQEWLRKNADENGRI